MTFLEQIQANNNPNSPARITARKALASMEAPVVSERITSVSTNDDGVTTTGIIDANGEEWAVITGWSWKVKD